jgi:putative membrane protein
MRYLMWFLRIALFLVLLGFTVKNAETVTVHYYFGYQWQAPLILIILLFFDLGLAI